MNIVISNQSQDPLYLQIEKQIKAAILKGELKDGDLLPSIRVFASELNVSVLTIRRVYSDLENEGFVMSQAGLGTYIKHVNSELLQDAKYKVIEEKMKEVVETAKMLEISKQEVDEILTILYEEEQ